MTTFLLYLLTGLGFMLFDAIYDRKWWAMMMDKSGHASWIIGLFVFMFLWPVYFGFLVLGVATYCINYVIRSINGESKNDLRL